MDAKTVRQQTELFHLIFIRQLGDKVDRKFFCLKGGCNLRFYFKSIRYSEDIDFDVSTVAKETLKKQVTKLLESDGFQRVLRGRNLEISEVTAPKQTDTTQRWKLKIGRPASSLPIPTKIEFSRRRMDPDRGYERVDSDLILGYELYPILCTHYTRQSALLQKLSALSDRTETQSRDVFDLDLLLQVPPKPDLFGEVDQQKLERASENCMALSFDDYQSQVVSYLAPEYQKDFDSPVVWNGMQEKVIAAIEKLKRGHRS